MSDQDVNLGQFGSGRLAHNQTGRAGTNENVITRLQPYSVIFYSRIVGAAGHEVAVSGIKIFCDDAK